MKATSAAAASSRRELDAAPQERDVELDGIARVALARRVEPLARLVELPVGRRLRGERHVEVLHRLARRQLGEPLLGARGARRVGAEARRGRRVDDGRVRGERPDAREALVGRRRRVDGGLRPRRTCRRPSVFSAFAMAAVVARAYSPAWAASPMARYPKAP